MDTTLAREGFDLLTTVVDGLGPDDWDRPSNLDGWTVRDVVAHVTGSVAKVEKLATDEPVDQVRSEPAAWRCDEPASELRARCRAAMTALESADPGASRQMHGRTMPLAAAVAFPIADAAIHAWDVEHSLGRRRELSDAMLDHIDRITATAGEAMRRNFDAPVPPRADATRTEEVMARLGRPTE